VLADWLDANEKPLDLLVKASIRPRRYEPLLCRGSDEGMVFSVFRPPLKQRVEALSALVARALLKLNDGKHDDAWRI